MLELNTLGFGSPAVMPANCSTPLTREYMVVGTPFLFVLTTERLFGSICALYSSKLSSKLKNNVLLFVLLKPIVCWFRSVLVGCSIKVSSFGLLINILPCGALCSIVKKRLYLVSSCTWFVCCSSALLVENNST